MDQPTELYDRYVQAVKFFNTQVERKFACQTIRSLLRLEILSQSEFLIWWKRVSAVNELQARWLARFEDPAGYFIRTCQRITAELDRIPIERVAA